MDAGLLLFTGLTLIMVNVTLRMSGACRSRFWMNSPSIRRLGDLCGDVPGPPDHHHIKWTCSTT